LKSGPQEPWPDDSLRAAELAARHSYGKLVAYLSRRTRDLAAAQDALSDAFEAALLQWPVQGVPHNPDAWLMAVAKRQAIDALRRKATSDAATDELQLFASVSTEDAESNPREVPDDRLALLFACAHPAIERSVRAPLMLQTVLGLDAAAIASAFLVPPTTMGQRLSRAKTKIKQAGIAFKEPQREDLPERLDTVLQAIYAAFTQGWADPAGLDSRHHNLSEEGIWLGQVLVALLPNEPEALGLLALMLHAQARSRARRDSTGAYVPLTQQDPSRWDTAMIDEAERLLHRASGMQAMGRFQLEAAVQSAHAVRRHTGQTDWAAVAQLYGALAELTGSVVVEINRAVAVSQWQGTAQGLAILERIGADPQLQTYQPYWAAFAHLLARSGAVDQADAAYAQAIGLESDPAVRRYLQVQRNRLKPLS
jgi:RNA polymerase sigma-70 factor, ECF subfamily